MTTKKMATTFNIHSRLPSKTSRFQISIDSEVINADTDSVISLISKELQAPSSDFDVLYAGKVLKPGTKLSNYLLQDRSTLFVVRKFTNRPQHQAEIEVSSHSTRKNDVIMAIQSALLNQDYRSTVERMLLDPESIENVIAATPGLDNDPAVLLMLQDPELLAILAHPNNLESLLQKHPSFAQAALTIATVVNEESAKSGKNAHKQGSTTYSLDQMSDDEDEEMPSQPVRTRGPSGGQRFTASQLAAALQTATGASAQPQASSSSMGAFPSPFQSTPAPGPSGSGSTITNDFFQQAMAHAQSASSEAALQQLREMGITDENVARQALVATNGDIQAAIDLIFGDGFM